METVYIETTVVSYLVADKNADAVTTMRREVTRLWWDHRRPWFACFISEEVVDEAGAGDAEQVRLRLEALRGMERLPISGEVGELAAAFLETGTMPHQAARDAVHLAVAACSGLDFLFTQRRLIQMLTLARAYWNLIRGAKKWLALTLCLFCFGFAGAVVFGIAKPTLIEQVVEHLHGNPETGFRAFVLYLKHNLTALLIIWCGGFVPAIAPLSNILATGFILGSLLVDRGVLYSFLSIFPHGIVEIPALLVGNAFSLRLGLRWIFQKTAGGRKRTFVTDLQNSLKISLLCMFLIVLAALIETFATPKILAAYDRGHLAGIGVQLAVHEHQLTITHVFPDRPASKAGLVSGLVIHKVDGVETAGKDIRQGREMLHGRVGTKVRLELIDTARNQTNSIELVRDLSPL